MFEKESTGRALSHEATEEIGERHHDGVDVSLLDERGECRPIEFVWCRHRLPDRDERATR
jgi:hypothetical protein